MPTITLDLFSHGGEAGRKLAAVDWKRNPIGPVEDWPPALRIVTQLMLASSFPKALCWGPELITIHNDAFRPILGRKPEAQGRPFPEIWAEAWDEIAPMVQRAMEGEATFIENFPLTIERNGYPEECNFTFCYSPIYDEAGRVAGMMDTVIETTQTIQAQRALRVRNAELAHRMKNTFAIVSAIARRTLTTAPDTATAWDKLAPRLGALSEAHMALTEWAGHAASIREVVTGALQPHVGEAAQVMLDGPPLRLGEREAMAVSLAINELATNAVKHGALGSGGTVSVYWDQPDTSAFRLRWTEHGGPAPAAEAPSGGFGMQLLERIIPQDVSGEAEFRHEAGCLEYILTGRFEDSFDAERKDQDRAAPLGEE
ncbi:PAS domain-containing protein [Aquicoccus sp. SCR17]|nr:PAS domain-containing protein [Carideicomes alvinocaridis]